MPIDTLLPAALGATLALGGLAVAQGSLPLDVEPTRHGVFGWPEGPLLAALLALPVDAEPAACGAPLWPGAEDDPAWDAAEGDLARPWAAWVSAVEGYAAEPRGSAALDLAEIALAQGRDEWAWRCFASGAADQPAQAAALLPRFWPGWNAPAGRTLDAPGGGLLALPAGVTLTPALPPPVTDDPEVLLAPRAMDLSGLRIGDTVVNLRLHVRGDGVDFRVEHVSGPGVEFQVVLPYPPGFKAHLEYADWDRQERVGGPLPVRVIPGEEAYRLWGRFRRDGQRPEWRLPNPLPEQVRQGGLSLALDPRAPGHARLAGLAPALERLLELPVAVDDGAPRNGWTPIRVDLLPGPRREAMLRTLLELSEAQRLAQVPTPAADSPAVPDSDR
ncbi:MAG: hypothetical protein ACYS26_04975 [Planctomycetota bacterium]|jgi:hypothetical protein